MIKISQLKSLLNNAKLRHMNILIDYELQCELLKILNDYENLQEENLLLRASEPMSKLQEDYGYKAKIDKAYKKLIKSKEYIAVKSLGLNKKMSILIELEEILGSDKE